MTHALRRDAPVICASCGRQVQRQSRQQRFCSARCKEKGRTRVRRAFLGTDTGAPTNPPKNGHEFNGLQGKKTRSSLRILAPPRVLAAEVWGSRHWQETVSSGGVAVEVSRVRSRSLVS